MADAQDRIAELSEAAREELNRRCDRFEQACKSPSPPSIERYLAEVDESQRTVLFRELLYLEIHYRRERGEAVEAGEYRARFPQFAEMVDEVIDGAAWPPRTTSKVSVTGISEFAHASQDAPEATTPPERIGPYPIEGVLGSGGFGVVYRGRDEQLQRLVAIKVPHKHRVAFPGDVEQYLVEARTVAQLEHPQIVPVFHVGSTDAFPLFVVSKYIAGHSLAQGIRESRLSYTEAAKVIETVAQALHYAHKLGVVHRDVKPGNILVDTEGRPYVADFGLALREADLGKGSRSAGTPAYMSPEQARGEGHRVDGRSDVYSLGAVLYELLTGRHTFSAKTKSELLNLIAEQDPKPPRQIDERIPKELERICLKSLSRRATDRYTTAKDMADDLRHFLTQQNMAPVDPALRSPARGFDSTVADARAATPVADSDRRPIGIVPKGLRSFDEHDADFFLELLPGPRDRDGLPESIRFWKTRIEETDADKTFSVGLIYGPSGCGKSSLMRAGLLPRLSSGITAVYVETTAEETEARLLRGLRKHCPTLEKDLNLKDTLSALRRGEGTTTGEKVLIVLDQFEQWLHAHRDRQDTELVQALRQCDGSNITCIVLARDDFWLAVSRFFIELEVDLVPGRNVALVDLFDPDHARKVLAAFGRAFGKLPEISRDLSKEHECFLDQAVLGLSEEGKIICVRLSLFAEMVRGKVWKPATLRDVGGVEGLGVTFLDETFSDPKALPKHRQHQRAARAVLKTLLPESGTDIKGQMKSYDELLEASDYANRLKDFNELIKILDSEVRLITPTDPEGTGTDDESVAEFDTSQKYYQLAHDYLVPSLRDWLTRKQRETRRGRAELRLAERSALWNAKRENRHLPAWWEYGNIGLLTDKTDWTEPQRNMMARAGRVHGVRWGVALLATLLVSVAVQRVVSVERHRNLSNQVETTIASLNTSRGIVQPPLTDLDDFPRDMVLEELRERFEMVEGPQRIPLAYALARYDDVRADFLVSQIENVVPDEVDNFVEALGASNAVSTAALERAVGVADSEENWRYKARLAMMALHLEAPSLAQHMCSLQPDPIQRTLFIEECSTWHGDLATLAKQVVDADDGPFRSGIALVVGSVPVVNLSPSEQQAWKPLLSRWRTMEPDTLTHSAAGWTLRQWGEEPQMVPPKQPSEGMAWHINSVGMTMLEIPAGSFVRRDEDEGSMNQTVTLTRSFLLADYEVTRAQFQQFVDDPEYPNAEKPHNWEGADVKYSPTLQHPVQQVSWYDAVLFCNWLSQKEGLNPCYERSGKKETFNNEENDAWRLTADGNGYRLPTEAEWEYAYRAGTVTDYGHGDDESLLERYAVQRSNRTELPGSKLPNGWGLFDVHGNVWEWCQDWYGPYGSEASVRDPLRSTGQKRVLRGGSFVPRSARVIHAGTRGTYYPYMRTFPLGFRVARDNP